jgi:hypothetical protein
MARRPFPSAARTGAVLAFALFSFVPSGRAEPAPAFRLEDHVPASSLAFASLEGIGTWGERFQATALWKIAQDPEMQAFARPIGEDLTAAIDALAGQRMGPDAKRGVELVQSLGKALEGLRGQVALALTDVAGDRPVLAASLDFGEHVSDFKEFLSRVQVEIAASFGESPIRSEESDGKTWWAAGPKGDEQVFATDLGSAFVVSNDLPWLKGVVAAGGGKSAAPLSDAPTFQATRGRSNVEGASAWLFANVARILSVIPIDDDDRRVVSGLGLDAVQGASYSLSFAGDGFRDTFVLYAPGADHGIVPMLRTRPTRHPALALVPSNAFYYSDATYSLSEALKWFRTMIETIEPREARVVEEFLAHARQALGVDLEKDVLAGLSDEMAAYLAFPQTGGLYPELAIFLGVEDAAAFEPVFEKAVAGLAGAVSEDGDVVMSQRTVDYRGVRLHVVELAEARGDDVVPFTPTWALLGGRLVVTAVPHTMKEVVLRSQEGATSPGLSGEEDFRALQAVAPKDAGAMEYYDVQALLSLLYDTGVPLLQTVVKRNLIAQIPVPLRVDWAQLPATRTIRPYFRSVASHFTGDESGWRLSVQSPVPAVPLLVAAGAAVALVGREGPRRSRGIRVEPPAEVEPLEPPTVARPADVEAAQALLEDVGRKVIAHGKAMGDLPASLEDLVGPGRAFGEAPRDPWGTPFRYKAVDRAENVFELRSAGPNRTFADADDVVRQFEAD